MVKQHKTKAECEKEFVEYILLVGIERWCEMDERNKTYYQIWLENGEIRNWTNLSGESLKKLGWDGGVDG
jgi:hypothetical protein